MNLEQKLLYEACLLPTSSCNLWISNLSGILRKFWHTSLVELTISNSCREQMKFRTFNGFELNFAGWRAWLDILGHWLGHQSKVLTLKSPAATPQVRQVCWFQYQQANITINVECTFHLQLEAFKIKIFPQILTRVRSWDFNYWATCLKYLLNANATSLGNCWTIFKVYWGFKFHDDWSQVESSLESNFWGGWFGNVAPKRFSGLKV